MNEKSKVSLVAGIAAVLISTLNGCSSLPQFTSERITKPIEIDGDKREWTDVSAYIDKNNTMAVSVCHDTEYFYMCLMSQDPQVQMQVMHNGLTVWLDNRGSDHKTFGINFPLNKHDGGPPPMMERGKMHDFETSNRMMEQAQSEMEIVGEKESDRYRLSITNTEGIKVKIGRSREGILIYELQVPLRKTAQHPHAIEIADDAYVGLGIETAEMELSMGKHAGGRPGGQGGGEMGFSGGPQGGGPPGGGGGMPSGGPQGGSKKSESVKMWWKVKIK